MAINSSRRKDETEKDDRDDNVDALRRLIDGLQPAIVKLESDLEDLLGEDEIEHDEPVPETDLTFGRIITAQAAGDAAVLFDRGRPVARTTLQELEAATS